MATQVVAGRVELGVALRGLDVDAADRGIEGVASVRIRRIVVWSSFQAPPPWPLSPHGDQLQEDLVLL